MCFYILDNALQNICLKLQYNHNVPVKIMYYICSKSQCARINTFFTLDMHFHTRISCFSCLQVVTSVGGATVQFLTVVDSLQALSMVLQQSANSRRRHRGDGETRIAVLSAQRHQHGERGDAARRRA